jgi:hypothetical protein
LALTVVIDSVLFTALRERGRHGRRRRRPCEPDQARGTL